MATPRKTTSGALGHSLSGTWTAIVTPFEDSSGAGEPGVDFDALDRIVDEQIAGGVTGIVVCGTTGESPTLSHDEHDQVVARVVDRAAGSVPVMAGAGSNSTREAVRLSRAAAEAGADLLLHVCPYYNKPSQRMLYEHFSVLARESSLPIVLYDVPGRTGVHLEAQTVARLHADWESIVAIKSAAGSVEEVARIRQLSDIAVLSGDDSLTLPMCSVGASGVISVASNALPALIVGLVESIREGGLAAARELDQRLRPLFGALFVEPNPVPVKCAMRLLGRGNGVVRGPLLPATPETETLLRRVLDELGVL